MAPRCRISGPAIVGLADCFVGAAKPGAARPAPRAAASPAARPAAPPTPPPPGGQASRPVGFYGKIAYNPAVENNGQVLSAAARVLQQGQAATKAAALAATSHKRPASLTTKAPVRLGAAAAAVVKTLSPKAQRAVAAQRESAARADAAARTAGNAALAANKSLVALKQQMQRQQAVSAKLFRRTGRGAPAARVGLLVEQAYAEIGALPAVDRPGFLDSGDPDPLYDLVADLLGEDAPPVDPATMDPGAMPPDLATMDPGLPAGPDAGADAISFADLDLASLPPPPPMDTFIPDYRAVNGVPYDESKGRPPGFLVSFKLADSRNPETGGIVSGDQQGYLFGGRQGVSGWPGENPSHWISVHGQRGRRDWWDDIGDWSATQQVVQRSMAENRGPIVGNPLYPDFKAARVDASGTVFWMPQEAPAWLTFPLLQAAQLTKQAAQKAAADAAAAAAAASAKAQADADEALRQQEAQNALAESQAASAANQAASQAAQTTSQAEGATAQETSQQAQLETQAQKLALEQARARFEQEQTAYQERRQAEAAFRAQGGGYAPEGGGYDDGGGYADDGYGSDNDGPSMGLPPDDGGEE